MKGMERLHCLLNDKGRQLVNVKFFPGSGRGLTDSQLAEAACEMLTGLDFDNLVDGPPFSGVVKGSF